MTTLAAGCRFRGRQAPPRPPSAAAVPGHLSGHDHRNVGGRGDGRAAAEHDDFWQLFVRPPNRQWRLATPPGVASNGGLVLASPGAGSVVAGFRPARTCPTPPSPPPTTTAPPGHPACSTPHWPMSPTPWPPHRAAATCSHCSPAARPGCPARRDRLDASWLPARPSPPPPRAAAADWAASPPRRSAHPGSLLAQLHSPGTAGIFGYASGTWRLAGPHAPGHVRTPGDRRPLAHHHRRHHHGIAGGRHRISGSPAGRLVHRRRCPLGAVAAAAAARRRTHIRLVQARRHRGGGTDGNHAQAITGPARMAATARPATRHGNTCTRSRCADGDALAVRGAELAIWQLPLGGAAWAATQTISVPIVFGSSADASSGGPGRPFGPGGMERAPAATIRPKEGPSARGAGGWSLPAA